MASSNFKGPPIYSEIMLQGNIILAEDRTPRLPQVVDAKADVIETKRLSSFQPIFFGFVSLFSILLQALVVCSSMSNGLKKSYLFKLDFHDPKNFLGTGDTKELLIPQIYQDNRDINVYDIIDKNYTASDPDGEEANVSQGDPYKDSDTAYSSGNSIYTLDYQFHDLDYLNSYFNPSKTATTTSYKHETSVSTSYVTGTSIYGSATSSTKSYPNESSKGYFTYLPYTETSVSPSETLWLPETIPDGVLFLGEFPPSPEYDNNVRHALHKNIIRFGIWKWGLNNWKLDFHNYAYNTKNAYTYWDSVNYTYSTKKADWDVGLDIAEILNSISVVEIKVIGFNYKTDIIDMNKKLRPLAGLFRAFKPLSIILIVCSVLFFFTVLQIFPHRLSQIILPLVSFNTAVFSILITVFQARIQIELRNLYSLKDVKISSSIAPRALLWLSFVFQSFITLFEHYRHRGAKSHLPADVLF